MSALLKTMFTQSLSEKTYTRNSSQREASGIEAHAVLSSAWSPENWNAGMILCTVGDAGVDVVSDTALPSLSSPCVKAGFVDE